MGADRRRGLVADEACRLLDEIELAADGSPLSGRLTDPAFPAALAAAAEARDVLLRAGDQVVAVARVHPQDGRLHLRPDPAVAVELADGLLVVQVARLLQAAELGGVVLDGVDEEALREGARQIERRFFFEEERRERGWCGWSMWRSAWRRWLDGWH